MPPKQRITREMILERSFEMFCREGMEAVNARSVAKALNCSTQPIFSYYAGMDDLKNALENKAKETFEAAITNLPEEGDLLVNICKAYVGFAFEQPCLFKYLFVCSNEGPAYQFMTKEKLEEIGAKEAESTGLELEQTGRALRHMSVYAHGYASLLAGGQLSSDMETICATVDAAHKYILIALRREEA
ncbi:MAG: TetR/AcrR family transcriptional regulator [Clostridia bacterium]|nr:TetR/AcrR family transcriptional regulator [Clostridia bacterium]